MVECCGFEFEGILCYDGLMLVGELCNICVYLWIV